MRRYLLALCMLSVALAFPGTAGAKHGEAAAQAAILYVSDGMRPDLAEQFAQEGHLPLIADLLRRGVHGDNGLQPALPPNTGTGWTTLATGAWPGVHGSTNNTFHQTGTAFTNSTSAFGPGVIQAETLAEAAERGGKRVVAFEYDASRNYPIHGPAIDFFSTFSRRGVITTFDPPTLKPQLVTDFGLSYTKITLQDATGWVRVPSSERPAREATLVIPTTNISANPERKFFLYIYDSTFDGVENYDHVLIAPSKDGALAVADLTAGPFAEVKVKLTDGRTAGLYVKVMDLAANLSKFRLYFTSVSRVNANNPALEEQAASTFPTVQSADFGPLEAGIVDEETYVQQGLLWESSHLPILRHLITANRPGLLMLGFPQTDEFSHQFLALITPGTPVYDPQRATRRKRFLLRAYEEADRTLALALRLMPRQTAVFISADHGFAAVWRSVNAGFLLQNAGLASAPQPGNCRPAAATEKVKACWTGGSVQFYVNLVGRDDPGAVQPSEFESVRHTIVAALANLRDGRTKVVDRIFLREDLRRIKIGKIVQTTAHPTRTGDVVALLHPPYQFDGFTAGVLIADSPFFGQHGYWPDLVDLRRSVDMHSVFIAAGPGIRAHKVLKDVAMVDVAPTLAAVLGIPAPANAQGKVLVKALENLP